ncbi:MAG: S8 family serine peptidase [Bacteroidales bacterium]|nr:S8 family serine peptidase [Bacteroidales bacterium]
MKRICVYLPFLFFILSSFSQTPAKYWIQFTDKNKSEYSVDRPNEFLSPRTVEKRKRFNIPVTVEDLPVNKNYIQEVLSLDSTMVLFTCSKWLNGITVYAEEEEILDKIKKLPFVAFAERTILLKEKEIPCDERFYYNSIDNNLNVIGIDTNTIFSYGKSTNQIRINNIHWLHRLGYSGQGIHMMIMDGGFHNVDSIRHFEILRKENRLLGARNFVEPCVDPMRKHSHGTYVLSCIASEVPNELIGSAPNVFVYLAQTEDSRSENKIEEDNWVAGIEWADSLGCDVLNSSLGYTKFDDPNQPRTAADLNGKVSRASQAATIAAKKGIIVCNSAGNAGNDKWKYIGCPADAEDILAVGGINVKGERAEFSSYGPTADSRIKPDACAVGRATYVANPFGKTLAADGTSFSSPLLAGMVSCLWQAFPEKTTYEIINAIRQSGHQATKPDSSLGYGITDFFKAYNLLLQAPPTYDASGNPMFEIQLNTFVYNNSPIIIKINSKVQTKCTLQLKLRNGESTEVKEYKIPKGKKVIKIKELPSLGTMDYGFVDLYLKGEIVNCHYVIGMEKEKKKKELQE